MIRWFGLMIRLLLYVILNYFFFVGVMYLEFLGINSNLVFFFLCFIFLFMVRV